MANNVLRYTQDWKKDENGVILIPDEVLLKGALEKESLELVFSPLGGRRSQPKHKGDKMVQRMKLPVLHPENRLDNGINANAAKFMTNRWYAYDSNDVQVGNPEGYATQAEAAAAGVSGKEKSGAGTCYYGDADFNTVTNGIPVLGEEGGDVNAVNVSSKYVYGTVKKRGIQSTWYKDAIDKDSRPGLLAEIAQGLTTAVRDLREAEIQGLLLSAASANVVLPDTANSAAIKDLTSQDELTYKTLLNWELDLKKNRVPLATKMSFGSSKINTVTIDSAWIVYIASEQKQTIVEMKDASGNSVFDYAHTYGASTTLLKNELGRVGKFRFVEVFNMQKYKAAGATLKDKTAAGEQDEFSAYTTFEPVLWYPTDDNGVIEGNDGYNTEADAKAASTNDTAVHGAERYDVFPSLLVGSDSFDILDFSANSMSLQTAMPKVSAYDKFGDTGVMSLKYWVGVLVKRSERLSVVKSVVRN